MLLLLIQKNKKVGLMKMAVAQRNGNVHDSLWTT